MPYVRWEGVDISGKIHSGKQFIPSQKSFDAHLFRQGIALTSCQPKFFLPYFWTIKIRHKMLFFRQLATLLESGILIADAIFVIAEQIRNPRMQAILYRIDHQLREGHSFNNALKSCPFILDELSCVLIRAGEESGNLARAMNTIALVHEMRNDFRIKLKNALLMPGITAAFFLFVVGIVFTMITPQFESLYASIGHDMPQSTFYLFFVREYLFSMYNFLFIGATGLLTYLLFRCFPLKKARSFFQKIQINIPFFGPMYRRLMIAQWTQSIALLLEGGLSLVEALSILEPSFSSSLFYSPIVQIREHICGGGMLSTALRYQKNWFSYDMIALVAVGEEAETLPFILQKIAERDLLWVKGRLDQVTTIVQPLLMIILGLLVALLIFAVYMPIVTMASIM